MHRLSLLLLLLFSSVAFASLGDEICLASPLSFRFERGHALVLDGGYSVEKLQCYGADCDAAGVKEVRCNATETDRGFLRWRCEAQEMNDGYELVSAYVRDGYEEFREATCYEDSLLFYTVRKQVTLFSDFFVQLALLLVLVGGPVFIGVTICQ